MLLTPEVPRYKERDVVGRFAGDLIDVKTKRHSSSWYDTWSKIKRWSLIQFSPQHTANTFRRAGLGNYHSDSSLKLTGWSSNVTSPRANSRSQDPLKSRLASQGWYVAVLETVPSVHVLTFDLD